MQILKNIANLFYPNICMSCSNVLTLNEEIICVICRHDLPFARITNRDNNILEKSFFGRLPIEEATSLFFYPKKGNLRNLIHQLKYKGNQEIGIIFGELLSESILQSNRFKQLDAIIPVPLHKNKLKKRSYNQLTTFGNVLANSLKIDYIEDVLIKVSDTKTQSKKGRIERWTNISEKFEIQHSKKLENKHILLIDDIVTTGATLESCSNELLKINNIKISIAVMAYTF